MIKRTLYFGNPFYLKLKNEQLVMNLPNANGWDDKSGLNVIPIEDIGVLILDHPQITITHALMSFLLEKNVAIITCDHTHHPVGLMLPLEGNYIQSERFKLQIESTEPFKKQLWQQTIRAKIYNQAKLIEKLKKNSATLWSCQKNVLSGDTSGMEARAAGLYWKLLFDGKMQRDRFGSPPNHLLNYGYAILRALVARELVSAGLLPTLGIHHHNRYNAYCLADDIMEPYRPYVDELVLDIYNKFKQEEELTKEIKVELLTIPYVDVLLGNEKSPLQIAVRTTSYSLFKCFEGKAKKIVYPQMA